MSLFYAELFDLFLLYWFTSTMTTSQTTALSLLPECCGGGAKTVDRVTSIAGDLLSFLYYFTGNNDILLKNFEGLIRALPLCLLCDFALLLLLLLLRDTPTYLPCARL